MTNLPQILQANESGDQQVAAALLPLVYDELRRLAKSRLASGNSEHPGQTSQATELVHEAYRRSPLGLRPCLAENGNTD